MDKTQYLFPAEFFTKTYNYKDYSKTECFPIFKIPIGFTAFSLYHIAQYYDSTAIDSFNMFVFDDKDKNFSSEDKDIDFSPYLEKISYFYLKDIDKSSDISQFLMNVTDRNPLIMQNIVKLGRFGFTEAVTISVPSGKEDGIIYSLSSSRNFDLPQNFLVDCTPDSIPRAVLITVAQPLMLNNAIHEDFPLISSVVKKREKAQAMTNDLTIGQFELQWAIVTLDGIFFLIICRHPFYLRVTDNYRTRFNSLEDAFGECRVLFVSYMFSEFAPDCELTVNTSTSKFHDDKIPGDNYYKEIATKNYSEVSDDIKAFLVRSIEFPSLYFKASNYNLIVGQCASLMAMYPMMPVEASKIASALVRPSPNFDTCSSALNDYNRYLLWLRSMTTAMKAMTTGKLDRLIRAFSSAFFALPGKNEYLVSVTFKLAMRSIGLYRKKRGMNDSFFEKMLLFFKHVLGNDFDEILGINRFDVFKSVRNFIVTVDTCGVVLLPLKFSRKTVSPLRAGNKLVSAIENLENTHNIKIEGDDSQYSLNSDYYEFLKSQTYEECIMQ